MSAYISTDGRYRYNLLRDVGPECDCWIPMLEGAGQHSPGCAVFKTKGTVAFVGLNPSTADATIDDQTIRRCKRFAADWGYGLLVMLNLYAYRATDPDDLAIADDPVGPENDRVLASELGRAHLVIVAWGADRIIDRARVALVLGMVADPHCLGLSKGGHPRHPLYMPTSSQPIAFTPA